MSQKDDNRCKACGQKPGNCIGHVQMRESVYENGVVKPSQSYAMTSLGTWGNKWLDR